MKDLLQGASLLFSGCRDFYRDPGLWKYAVFPLLVILLFYFAAVWGVFAFAAWASAGLEAWAEQLPGYLSWLGYGIKAAVYSGAAVFLLLLLTGTVSTFYEMTGGFFFDSLAEQYIRKRFGLTAEKKSFRRQLSELPASCCFGLKTAFFFLLLLTGCIIFPFAGEILLTAVMGYFFGLSCMIPCACCLGSFPEMLKKDRRGNRLRIAGFGICGYLLMQIPLAVLLLLPGMILGGCRLFLDEQKK